MLPVFFLLMLKQYLNTQRSSPDLDHYRDITANTRFDAETISAVNSAPKASVLDNKKILCGFWFEWPPHVDLSSIPKEYNMICIAFLEQDVNGIPTFAPKFNTDDYFINGIKKLKSEGREVLVSIGGAGGHILVNEKDKNAFKNGLTQIIDKYGFSGIDIDLEEDSIKAGDNQTVIPAVLREIKDYYRSKGINFIITMAPEFVYLRGYDAAYKPYIENLEGYYDLIFPQYYNQGEDGIWSDEYHMYLSQNDNANKAQFLYTLTHAIVTGTQDYIKIPANKFALGLPAAPISASNGYVEKASDVQWALNRLSAEGNAIRGLMTWSINQDANNGYEFMKRYAPIIFATR